MGCFTGDSSGTSRDYTSETSDTLQTQLSLAPWLYQSEAVYEPLYTQLGVNNAYTAVFGTGGNNGLLNLYSEISPTLTHIGSQERTDSRLADIADVGRMGYGALLAEKASDPANAMLVDTLTSQAQNELGLGSNLSPAELRQAQQSVRQRQAGMLGGTGAAGDLGEALGVSQYGQQLRQQRQGLASSVSQLRNKIYGDPFQTVLGRPSNAMSPMQVTSQAQGFNSGNIFNPESSYASNIYGSNAGYTSMYSEPSTLSKIQGVESAY